VLGLVKADRLPYHSDPRKLRASNRFDRIHQAGDVPKIAQHLLLKFADVRADELRAVLWSFAYFFCLLCGYYVLRPIRDEMGIQIGVGNLAWLFTATFVAMLAVVPLFGWISSRFPRRRFLPYAYLFFVANLLLFFFLFREKLALDFARKAFFVWVSVFNLFVVSVFWSFMADLYDTAQARRLYGFIAAGGSAGAVAGPALTTALALPLGPVNLLLVSAGFLIAATGCILQLSSWRAAAHRSTATRDEDRPVGGGVFDGIRLVLVSPYLLMICAYIVLYSILSTMLYFEQQQIVKAALASSSQRTQLFAAADLVVNVLTLSLQLVIFSRFLRRFGIAGGLVLIPLLSVPGFIALGIAPTLMVLMTFGVLRRAAEFAICKPARETLFNALAREEKYKAKNFMDTAVYRAADMASGWMFQGLQALGLSLSAIAYLAAPASVAWAAIGVWLSRRHRAIAEERSRAPAAPIPQEQT
jgi:AAA family ATP:ADP antiporter